MPFQPERLRALRKRAGLSQESLALLIGSASLSVNAWECGRDLPKAESIEKVAHVLEVPMGTFYVWEEEAVDADS